MQDRFKFRIWDKHLKKMFDCIQINFTENAYGSNKIKDDECSIHLIYQPHLELMQCSGLKDKNGKLIYEGDILDLYVSSKKLYRYEVKYEIGSFMLVSQDEIFDFKNVWNDNVYPLSQLYYEYQNEENCIDECEVIGNIYENPELLEEASNDN